MSTRRANTRKKKKAKNGPEPIVTRHEREGNMNFFAEEITKSIVDKIISLTITRHFLNDLNPKLPLLCFNNIKREIGKYIHCQFIAHDREDVFFINRQSQSNSITELIRESTNNDFACDLHFDPKEEGLLYDNYFNGSNYWGDIPQPASTRKERNACTQINYARKEPVNTKKKLEVVLDEQLKTDDNNVLSPPRNSMQRSVMPLSIRESSGSGGVGVGSSSGNTSGIGGKDGSGSTKQKNMVANLISHDLPPDEDDNYLITEDEFITVSRKEFFDEKERLRLIEEEEAKKLQAERKKEMNREENEKAQLKNSRFKKNCTNDADCKLVYIKDVMPDTLKIEFSMAKCDSRDIVPYFSASANAAQDKKKETISIKNQPTLLNRIKDAVEGNAIIERKNSNNRDNVPSGRKWNVERLLGSKQFTSNFALQLNKEEITPCGSSFSLFTPEVGVSILENNQTKVGGKDYYRRYNKYSIENYNQKLRDTLHLSQTSYIQQNNNLSNSNSNSNSDMILDINSNNGGNQCDDISGMQSSLFKLGMPNSNNNSNSNINFNNTMLMPNKSLLKSNSNSNIKLNTSARFLSLRGVIDTLDLINEGEEEVLTRGHRHNNRVRDREVNFFKKIAHWTSKAKAKQRCTMIKEDKELLDEMDKFTKKISMNSFWGNEKLTAKASLPFKPIQRKVRQIKENEIDGDLNRTRASSLPRIRMKKKFNISSFNFTQSPIDNFTRINLNKTRYHSKDFFKVN